jgi:RecG-like helicase
VSQTEEAKTNTEPTTEQVERVRKVFVRDLSLQQKVHTVFRVAKKSRHLARNGKAFLALSLVDKTGEIPGRIFDNVEAANAAFEENDYLLVKGTVIHFRGKPQLLIEQLERLAPEPMDAGEFTLPEPPVAAEKQSLAPKNKPPKAPKASKAPNAPAPNIAHALEMLCSALETFIQEKIEQRLANLPAAIPSTNKPHPPQKAEPKPEPKAEPPPGRGLPKEFAFKPFDMLTAEENASSPPSENDTPSENVSQTPPLEAQESKPPN